MGHNLSRPKPGDCPDIFNCKDHGNKIKRHEVLMNKLNDVCSQHSCAVMGLLALCLVLAVVNGLLLWRMILKARQRRAVYGRDVIPGIVFKSSDCDDSLIHQSDSNDDKYLHGVEYEKLASLGHPGN